MHHPEMIVGYSLSGPDNGSFYYSKAPKEHFCPNCGSVIKDWTPPNLSMKRFHDLSFTYDNKPIMSKRLMQFFSESFRKSGRFVELKTSRGFYYYYDPTEIVEFDCASRNVDFSEHCGTCGQFRSIIGVDPTYLKVQLEHLQGVFKTNIAFGDRKAKSQVIIVGPRERFLIEAQSFTGISFRNAYARSRSSEN